MHLLEQGQYEQAQDKFRIISVYRDSSSMVTECDYRIYIEVYESGEYEEAQKKFEKIKTYKDSAVYIDWCSYNIAVKLYADGRYDDAYKIFKKLGVFSDSEDMAKECIYMKALELLANNEFIKAKEQLEQLGDYKDSFAWITECDYGYAVSEYNKKHYVKAFNIFVTMPEYKDSFLMMEKCRYAMIKYASSGSTVYWGSYEQDGNTENGPEPIAWSVVAYDSGRLLLQSVEIIDCRAYHRNSMGELSWENSDIRSWLNNSFFYTAFSAEEQGFILSCTVNNDNPENGYYSRATVDKVFLPSVEEADMYNLANKSLSLYMESMKEFEWQRYGYLLRTPYDNSYNIATLSSNYNSNSFRGQISCVSIDYTYWISPMIWLYVPMDYLDGHIF